MSLQWLRFGSWSAHLYVDGVQQCTTRHGHWRYGKPPDYSLRPEPAPLSAHGVPYGKVCERCARKFRALKSSEARP